MAEALRNLNLRPSYHKGKDDVAAAFYVPCMSSARDYWRAVGFFRSSVYALAWPALKEFVVRAGKIRMICSPVLAYEDMTSLYEGYSARDSDEAVGRLRSEIASMLADSRIGKPTRVLASLVAIGVLDLKVALVGQETSGRHGRLFHDKLGLFFDACGDTVAFKGSMNETWAGIAADGNLESVDVYLSWEPGRDKERVSEEVAYFESLWDDKYPDARVIPFPAVARQDLIDASDPSNLPLLIDQVCSEMEASTEMSPDRGITKRVPMPHQIDALRHWHAMGRHGILEHATGSGKTFTALIAIRESLQQREIPLIIVPTEELHTQWREEIRSTYPDIRPHVLLCGAGSGSWRRPGVLAAWTARGDRPRIVLATMQTASSREFLSSVSPGDHLLLVADEVHRLGAPRASAVFTLKVGPRLGLSATPRRAGDTNGTEAIMDFFGGVIQPPFTLHDAIAGGRLTPYVYLPHIVALTGSEQRKWDDLTSKIGRLYAMAGKSKSPQSDMDGRINMLEIARARVLKKAASKTGLAARILQEDFRPGERWLVYCDDTSQMRDVTAAARAQGLDAKEYNSAMKGDRRQTLRVFEANGGILVAIRCLDEGIDIPAASHGLILASSKNPREFIQRRGRLLRRAEGKSLAYIHDAIVVPALGTCAELASRIVGGELARAVHFGSGAENPYSVFEIRSVAARMGLDLDSLLDAGVEDEDEGNAS